MFRKRRKIATIMTSRGERDESWEVLRFGCRGSQVVGVRGGFVNFVLAWFC